MLFKRIAPDPDLQKIVECYWLAEDSSVKPQKEKIIPDGFTELIFHFGDPYRINLSGQWELQTPGLLAGQITSHFFLENTGATEIFGVKLRPTALTHLYNLSMNEFTDKVVDVRDILDLRAMMMEEELRTATGENRVDVANRYFKMLINRQGLMETTADRAVNLIFEKQGMVTVATLCDTLGISERQLENQFKKQVGLSPKSFCQIIRFNFVFQLVREGRSWSDTAYEAAYYDQSHFIRNFRNFTGENPADYSFEEKTMANFFLKKKT